MSVMKYACETLNINFNNFVNCVMNASHISFWLCLQHY